MLLLCEFSIIVGVHFKFVFTNGIIYHQSDVAMKIDIDINNLYGEKPGARLFPDMNWHL